MPRDNNISEFISASGSSIAVVPNKKWAEELNKLLASRGALLGRRIYTPRELLMEKAKDISPIIPAGLKRHLIKEILLKQDRNYFKGVSTGVVSAVLDAITKLKANRILPDELQHILSTRGGPKENDLLNAYREYQNELGSRGWHDEEDLWNIEPFDANNIRFIGFPEPTPGMTAVFRNAVFLKPQAQSTVEPEVFVFNSTVAEAEFIARELLKDPDSTVYLRAGEPFAWLLMNEFNDAYPDRSWTSQPLLRSLDNDSLPERASLKRYAEILLDIFMDETEKKAQTTAANISPILFARVMRQNDSIKRLFERIIFEWNTIHSNVDMTRREATAFIIEELRCPSWPSETPFRLASFAEAGLYDDTTAIIPVMNDGYMPPRESKTIFFREPDDLSPEPDERIAAIFPSQESVNEMSLNVLKTAFAGRTVITFHTHSEDGRETSPSPFITRFKRKITATAYKRTPIKETRYEITLKDPKAVKKLTEQLKYHVFSPSQLEKFGECPFSYYCEYMLGLEPPEERTPEVQPADRGTLIHAVLEHFFIKHGKDFMKMNLHPAVSVVVDEVFSSQEAKKIGSKYNEEMVRHLKKRVIRLVTAVLEGERETLSGIKQRPVLFEHKFKGIFTDGVMITGKIDRVDADETTFTVIDYKTGRTDPVRSGIENGTEFQMPVYSEMAARELKGKRPAAAFLYSTSKKRRHKGIVNKDLKDHVFPKGERARLTVSGEEWDMLMEKAKRHAAEYVKRIRDGCFKLREKDCNKFCEWKDACRV